MSLTKLLLIAWLTDSAESPRHLTERLFAAFNRHDAAALQALYAPQAVLRSSDFCAARSGADVQRTYEALFQAIPDIRDDVEVILVDGERVAVRFRSRGTGLDLRLMTMLRIQGGRIVEDDTLFDTGGRPCES